MLQSSQSAIHQSSTSSKSARNPSIPSPASVPTTTPSSSSSITITQPDAFWQSTPRSMSTSRAAFSAAMNLHEVKIQAHAATSSSALKPSKKLSQTATSRRPQCTHIAMTRLHGNHLCDMCGQVPSIGWLYICEQDKELKHQGPARPQQGMELNEDYGDDFREDMAQRAERLNMNSSIVQGIRNRDYSTDQVLEIIEQKLHLVSTIQKEERKLYAKTPPRTPTRSQENIIASIGARPTPAPIPSRSYLPMTPAGTPTNTPAQSTNTTPILRPASAQSQSQYCNFQVCHHCRPYLRDRVYMNIQAVLNGEIRALTAEDLAFLPVVNARTLLEMDLGDSPRSSLPQQVSDQSMDITLERSGTFHNDSDNWNPARQIDFDIDPYPCPGPGFCPVYGDDGCAYDGDFDDGLRALSHDFGPEPDLYEPDLSRITPESSLYHLQKSKRDISDTPGRSSSTASSMSVPTPINLRLMRKTKLEIHSPQDKFEDNQISSIAPNANISAGADLGHPEGGRPLTIQSRERRRHLLDLPLSAKHHTFRIMHKPSNSSMGSEVEVDGGVALTEEAVQTGTPDIANK